MFFLSKLKCCQNLDITQTVISPNLKCHQNWNIPNLKCYQDLNVTKTHIFPKLKCKKLNVATTETSPSLKCHQNWNVTKFVWFFVRLLGQNAGLTPGILWFGAILHSQCTFYPQDFYSSWNPYKMTKSGAAKGILQPP